MREIAPEKFRAFCRFLHITNRGTGAVTSFELNEAQEKALLLVTSCIRLIVLKGRQIGLTTIMLAYDLMFAMCNPGLTVIIAMQTDEIAKEKLGQIRAWCDEIGLPLVVRDAHKLVLSNGAIIKCMSSGSRAAEGQTRMARGGSASLLHVSELAFWTLDAKAFQSLSSAAFPDAKVIVESTGTAAQSYFRKMWDTATDPLVEAPEYAHLFIGVEDDQDARRDPRTISQDTWEKLQEHRGFTRRDTAAWWWQKLMGDYAGDVHGLLQEEPVKPADAWSHQVGRWIFASTKTIPMRETSDGIGTWRLYIDEPGEPCVLGVDTARGLERDSSAIAVIGLGSGSLIATYKSNRIGVEDYAKLVFEASQTFRPCRAVVVETNGVGKEVWMQLAMRATVGLTDQKSSDIQGEKDVRMRWVKRAIEAGRILCGPELQAEIEASIITEKGDWEGPDDLLNAISFALKWREANPWTPPSAIPDARNVYVPPSDKRGRRAHRGM